MSEEEWEKREREDARRARRGRILDIVTIALMLAVVVCLFYIAFAK